MSFQLTCTGPEPSANRTMPLFRSGSPSPLALPPLPRSNGTHNFAEFFGLSIIRNSHTFEMLVAKRKTLGRSVSLETTIDNIESQGEKYQAKGIRCLNVADDGNGDSADMASLAGSSSNPGEWPFPLARTSSSESSISSGDHKEHAKTCKYPANPPFAPGCVQKRAPTFGCVGIKNAELYNDATHGTFNLKSDELTMSSSLDNVETPSEVAARITRQRFEAGDKDGNLINAWAYLKKIEDSSSGVQPLHTPPSQLRYEMYHGNEEYDNKRAFSLYPGAAEVNKNSGSELDCSLSASDAGSVFNRVVENIEKDSSHSSSTTLDTLFNIQTPLGSLFIVYESIESSQSTDTPQKKWRSLVNVLTDGIRHDGGAFAYAKRHCKAAPVKIREAASRWNTKIKSLKNMSKGN